MPLDPKVVSKLRGIVDGACADQKAGIPGTTVVVIGKDGEELFAHSAGKRGVGSEDPMTLDNIFWIASCTKMLTGVACMQLVEQGALKLDDGEWLENLIPELKDLKVLREDGTLENKKRAITLRMLLSHTAGFGYTFFNERLRDWTFPVGGDEFSGRFDDIKFPLLFQPGEGWEYGVGIDWAGVALQRVSGLTLNEYLTKHVFQPLGIKAMSMIPDRGMRSRLAYMNARDPDGKLRPRDHLLRLPLVVNPDDKAETASVFNSGGAGMFAKPQDYCKVLAVLLNDGTCPRTGAKILRKETVDEMFRNQIEKFPNASRQFIPASKPDLTNPIPELYPVSGNPPQGWGLTFMLSNGGGTGRSTRTGHWAGLPNLWWWCDPEHGVAGIVCTQILPFADAQVLGLWAAVEAEVYKAILSKRACDAEPLQLPDRDYLSSTTIVLGERPGVNVADISASGQDTKPCSYCTKTKKQCTMKWAWSQVQITAALAAAEETRLECMIPAKRARNDKGLEPRARAATADNASFSSLSACEPEIPQQEPQQQELFIQESVFPTLDLSAPFPDNSLDVLPFGTMPPDTGLPSAGFEASSFEDMTGSTGYLSETLGPDFSACSESIDSQAAPEVQFNDCFSTASQPRRPSATSYRSASRSGSSHNGSENDWARPKRRRTSRGWNGHQNGHQASSLSPFSVDQTMMARSNNQFISSNLLQIYHDVLEHNLSCWLTEVTCPYRAPGYNAANAAGSPTLTEWGSSWSNRIYRRTVKLDTVAQSTKLIQLSRNDDHAASKALHLAIMAFATQWAQGSRRQKERYPALADIVEDERPEDFLDEISEEFDRNIQRHFWEQAQRALQDVADVESYRVACAELIFGLTQKPWAPDDDTRFSSNDLDFLIRQENKFDPSSLVEELGDVINRDGPPVYMERAARKMHALKFQFDSTRRGLGGPKAGKKGNETLALMTPEDRSTVGLLYWLAVMFDTVSSSMSERPVVVADADSQHDDALDGLETPDNGRWNVPLFIQDSLDQPYRIVHWPCSYEAAAEAVTKSAPVKVLLYRHVSYLQNILRRGGRGEKVEEIIRNTTSVYRYWNMTHGAFFKELLHDYASVPGRLQSWFVCISAHWHLAALMLADLIEYVDENELGVTTATHSRLSSKMATRIREASARELSDLARVSTPDEELGNTMIAPQLSHFHHAVNEATILTEPWTIILIRAFSKAAVLLISEANDFLEFGLTTRGNNGGHDFQESLCRAEECVKGLWLLGKKSDMARKVADTLSSAMNKLRV
ncbi:hypothetical protein FDECE_3687 [Fusarium decemcellulare]|nr:hypothetical protein FDECE_3687 [Fusarium decemcellulare]